MNKHLKWIEQLFSQDLQEMGYKPTIQKPNFHAFNLTKEEWNSFVQMYSQDQAPVLHLNNPE